MIVRNHVRTIAPTVPEYLNNKFEMIATCELPIDLVQIFYLGLKAIVEQLQEDEINNESLTRVTALFTPDGEVSLALTSNDTWGEHFSLVVYPINRLNEINNQKFQLFVFIEELVHHYWNLTDETQTKIKVLEIINRITELTLATVQSWGVNWE